MATEQNQEEPEFPQTEEDFKFVPNPKGCIDQFIDDLRMVVWRHYLENHLSIATAIGCMEVIKMEIMGRQGLFQEWSDLAESDDDA